MRFVGVFFLLGCPLPLTTPLIDGSFFLCVGFGFSLTFIIFAELALLRIGRHSDLSLRI